MDGISSTPVENSVQFLKLRERYKSDLLDDSRLTKAAGLAAQQELLLESPAPDTWKEPRLKYVNRELRQWTKKIRQPGGTRAIGRDDVDTDDKDENNLAVGPLQQFMGNIAKIQKSIKRKAQPVTPQTPITPTLKQSPQTPSSSKKPKLSFKTGSKAKRLLPKTPKQKTPKSKTKPKTPSPTFSTSEEEEDFAAESPWEKAKESIKKSFNEAAKRAQERALKKIAPAPGWKPFGTPTKRKLHGKDW